jgi:hypothetical protein
MMSVDNYVEADDPAYSPVGPPASSYEGSL